MVLVHTVIVHLERTLLNRSHISEPKGLEKSCRISRRTKECRTFGNRRVQWEIAVPNFGRNGSNPYSALTLIGMRQGTLSAEFLPKISKLCTSIRLIWHPDKLIESYKKRSYVVLEMSIFLALRAHPNRVNPIFIGTGWNQPIYEIWVLRDNSCCEKV